MSYTDQDMADTNQAGWDDGYVTASLDARVEIEELRQRILKGMATIKDDIASVEILDTAGTIQVIRLEGKKQGLGLALEYLRAVQV